MAFLYPRGAVPMNPTTRPAEFDAVIAGARFSRIAMLHARLHHGRRLKVLEAAPDVGGTWYRNAYPGAHTDSASWYYCHAFSRARFDKWQWSERYPSQPEMGAP